ncbi:MAG: hypothetical protein ABIH29_01800 [Candidatus Micrarchaeota archaeon]
MSAQQNGPGDGAEPSMPLSLSASLFCPGNVILVDASSGGAPVSGVRVSLEYPAGAIDVGMTGADGVSAFTARGAGEILVVGTCWECSRAEALLEVPALCPEDVPGPLSDCGFWDDLAWVEFECCVSEDCPDGACVGHECIALVLPEPEPISFQEPASLIFDYDILANETTIIGNSHQGLALRNGNRFPEATVVITAPDGTASEVLSGMDGGFAFLPSQGGVYELALRIDGEALPLKNVTALVPSGGSNDGTSMFRWFPSEFMAVAFLFLLLAALAAFFYSRRARGGFEPSGKEKKE